MVKTENARCGRPFEEMLKDYIDSEKDSDATSKFLTDVSDINRMSEGNSSESTEVEQIVTTIVDDVFEIECSSVAEEIIIGDVVKVFDTSSPNSEVVEVIGNDNVEELQNSIVEHVNEITTDEHTNRKHVVINNELDIFFDKIPKNNDPTWINDLMEVDTPHANNITLQRTEDVEIISKDSSKESISQSNSTEDTVKPNTNDHKRTEISQSNTTKNATELSICHSTTVSVSQSNYIENTVEPNINDNKTVANENSDKPYKCHICGKCFSRASSRKCHIRLHVEGPDSLLRGSSEPVENSLKPQFVELSTKKEEVVEPVADENSTNAVPEDETVSNALNSSRDSCDLTEDEDKREYKCIVCEKTFSRRSSLTCHYKFHPKSSISKNQEDIPVEITNDEIATEKDVVEEVCAKEEQYKCDKCPRTFSQKNTYVWHTKMHETNVRKNSIDNTAPTTNLTNGVENTEIVNITNDVDLTENNAEKTDETVVKTYKCDLCPRSFPQLRGLKTHSSVHKRKPAYEQSSGREVLNQMFYEEVSSRKNVCCTKNHNHDDEMTKLYKCNVCCKCFCDMNNFKAHLARNHQEEDTGEASDDDLVVESQTKAVAETTSHVSEDIKDEKPPIIIPGLYKCGVCSETFDELQLLGDHVNIHIQAHCESSINISDDSMAEELCCVVCEKTFRSQNALSRHMNEHRRREEEVFVRVTSSGRKIRERRSSEDLITASPVKCIPCNRTFESIRAKHIHDFSKHPVEQTENEEKESANEDRTGGDSQQEEYICDCCNRRWANIRSLSRHKGWAKQRLSSLPAAGNSIVEPISVDESDPLEPDVIPVEENKTENDVSSSVKCGCCNELFPNIPALNVHLSGQTNGTITESAPLSPNRENENAENCDSLRYLVKCDRCDKFCSSIQALKLHIISDHTRKSIPQNSTDGHPSLPDKIAEKSVPVSASELPIEKDKPTGSVIIAPNDISSLSDDEAGEEHVAIKSKVKRRKLSVNQQPQLKPLQCDLCDGTFKSTIALNYHKSTHVIDSTDEDIDKPEEQAGAPEVEAFICCNKIFATSRAMKIHQYRHTSNTTVNIAPVSQQMNNSKAEAAKSNNNKLGNDLSNAIHSATDTESEEDLFRQYKCSICEKKFCTRKSLRYHREKHFKPGEIDPEFDGEFSCDKCHKSFDKKSSLRVHKAYHTTIERNLNAPLDYGCYSDLRNGVFRCNECDREFDTVKGVSMHCSKAHKESTPEPYSCSACDRTFSCCQGLAGHMSYHTKKETERICEICKKHFASKSNMNRHRRAVHGIEEDGTEEEELEDEEGEESEKEYPCPECDRIFPNYRGLNGHMQMHQLYCCSHCDLEFSTYRSYNAHNELNHTDVDFKSPKSDSMKSFDCDKCDRSFSSAKSLRGHKAVHSNTVRKEPEPEPEPIPTLEFKCAICDRSFSSAKSLGGHKSMHSRQGEAYEPENSENEAESAAEDADNEEEPSNEFPCPRCERFFTSARSLANHMHVHIAQDNPLELTCPQPQCERVFISHRALSAHYLTHRPDDSLQAFPCPKCKESFPVMKAMYDHFCAKHRRMKKVERISRRSLNDTISNDTEKRTLSNRSRSQVPPPAAAEEARKTRSKSVGDRVSSRDEKPVSSACSSESVNKDNSTRSSEFVEKENTARDVESINNDDAENTRTSFSVRKSRRLKSSTVITPSLSGKKDKQPMEVDTEEKNRVEDDDAMNTEDTCATSSSIRKNRRSKSSTVITPSLSGKKDNQPMEVDTEEQDQAEDDDDTKDTMQLSCVFNDCIDSTNDNSGSKPKCDICLLTFDDLKSLAKHLADSHESTINSTDKKFELGELQIRIHQCTQCDKIFSNRVGLRRHSLSHSEGQMKLCEPPSLQLKCALCPKILPTAIGLKRHSMTIHKTAYQREISAAVDSLPNSNPVQGEVSQTSDMNVNQTTTKRSAKETDCSKSKADQTSTKQSVNESKHSKSNFDQILIEQSVKEAESSKSNHVQTVVEQSVEEPEPLESNDVKTTAEQPVNESERSNTNVVQSVAEQSVEKTEYSKSIVDQTANEQSADESTCSKSNVGQTVTEQSVNEPKSSKSNNNQTLAKQSVDKTEGLKSNETMAKQSVNKAKPSKSNIDEIVIEHSVNEPKRSKSNVSQTVTEQSVNETKSPNSNANQTLAKRPEIDKPKPLTNGVDKSTTDTNALSLNSVKQKSVPNADHSIAPKDLPVKVTTTHSTELQHDHTTDDDAEAPLPAAPPAPAKTDDLLSCKICSRQFAHVKAFNKHQQWHKFNDRAVDVEEASTVNDDSKQHLNSNGPLVNVMVNLEVLAYVKCDICGEKFTKAENLKKHAFDVHTVTITSPILYQCNFCHKPFPRGKTLFLHLRSHASNITSDVSTNSPPSEEIMPFECASCEKCFRLKDDLLEHVRTHLADSESTPSSGEPLTNGSTQEIPLEVNGDSPNSSEHSENYELKIHSDDDQQNDTLKDETEQAKELESRNDSNVRKLQCPHCPRKFLRQNNLSFHLRSHSQDHDKQSKPTPQPTIRRRSVRLTDDVQMSIISPPKQHQCPICNESFRSKIILEMHSQKHSNALASKQSTAKSSRKSVKRSNDGDNFTPEDGVKSNKRVSKEVS